MSAHGLVVVRPDPVPALPTAAASDVLDAWLAGRNPNTLRGYHFDLTDFARFLKVQAKDPAAAAVEALLAAGPGQGNRIALAYRAHLLERGLASATIARRLSALRAVVKVGRQIGRIAWALDVESPKVEPYRDTSGPDDEEWALFIAKAERLAAAEDEGKRKLGKRNLALIRVLHDWGLRRFEPIAMNLSDVDLGRRTIQVIRKGKRQAQVKRLARRTYDALKEWIDVRGSKPGPLFIRLDPAAKGELERMTGDSVNRMTRRVSRRAGVSREVRPHGLRHRAITRALDKTDGNIRAAQMFSGHADPKTLGLYDDNRRDEASRISELISED